MRKLTSATSHPAVAEFTNGFKKDFATRFDGRCTKTAYHFFSWAYNYADGAKRDEALTKFKAYCKRMNIRSTWRNAAEWFATGAVMGGTKIAKKGGAK